VISRALAALGIAAARVAGERDRVIWRA